MSDLNLSTQEQSFTKDELWTNCLLYIKDRIQEQAYQTWFDGVIATNLNEEEITLFKTVGTALSDVAGLSAAAVAAEAEDLGVVLT